MAGNTDGDETEPADETDEKTDNAEKEEEEEWLAGLWYRSRLGRGIVVGDIVLTLILVIVTVLVARNGFANLEDAPFGGIPGPVYVISVLGALGFVFTALIEDFDRDTAEVLQHNFRLPAALPLGAGVFLLADVLLPDIGETGPLVLGLVFLSGLYVNLAYKELGALAKRLLPGDTDNTPTTETPENDEDAKKASSET